MEYLVGGYTMLNDILFADGSSIGNQLGGSVFSAAGIKLWRDDLAYIGIAGKDFATYYGEFFKENKIHTHVKEEFPYTLHYVMRYNADGSWQEYCKYGEKYEEDALKKSMLTLDMFSLYCDANTKGIYVEASLKTKIVGHFKELKSCMPKGKLMWEITTGDLMQPGNQNSIIELIHETDIFSMNSHEAKAFFHIDTEEEAIERLLELKKPCFFRAGSKGAYLIQNQEALFLPAVGVEESIDATGCGNSSTAAALMGFAEGLPPEEILAMANVAARYNARQYGPWPLVTLEDRIEAEKMKKRLMGSAKRVYG